MQKLWKKLIFVQQTQRRYLFATLVPVFNSVDKDRIAEIGANAACAEWLLRNGGKVLLEGDSDYLGNYDALQGLIEGKVSMKIKEIDASDASISHHGFGHLIDCNFVRKIILHKCPHVDDTALSKLNLVSNTLQDLQISSCGDVSDKGLLSLETLRALKTLTLYDLPHVKDKHNCLAKLQSALKQCDIDMR